MMVIMVACVVPSLLPRARTIRPCLQWPSPSWRSTSPTSSGPRTAPARGTPPSPGPGPTRTPWSDRGAGDRRRSEEPTQLNLPSAGTGQTLEIWQFSGFTADLPARLHMCVSQLEMSAKLNDLATPCHRNYFIKGFLQLFHQKWVNPRAQAIVTHFSWGKPS